MTVYLIEEVFELVDAIESGNPEKVLEELGDVLFQVAFIAGIFKERKQFTLDDAAQTVNEKMVRRHPHVFGDVKVEDVDEIKRNWHKIKMKEKGNLAIESVLDTVPRNLPVFLRAYRLLERAAKAGFDFKEIGPGVEKVDEEMAEFKKALSSGDSAQTMDELGDLVFALINVGRLAKVHPERALSGTVGKFEKRFRGLEKKAADEGTSIGSMSLDEILKVWNEMK